MPKTRVAVLSDLGGAGGQTGWLDDFVGGDALDRYAFETVTRDEPTRSSHARGAVAGPSDWRREMAYVRKAMRTGPDVLVTLFPQPAMVACALKRLTGAKTKIVGWAFNLGSTASPWKGRAAGQFLRSADRLVVHSSEEVERYAAWLGVERDIVEFVPLQQGDIHVPRDEADPPFALAMGSAGRDYAALAEAARGFPGRVVVVARPALLEGLGAPENVEARSGLDREACLALTARARITVVPVANLETASGQVTVIASMAQRVPIVATDCPGTRDYLAHEETALIVPPRDADALRDAMTRLWRDGRLRERLARNAYEAWRERFSDEGAARSFVRVLDEVTGRAADAPRRVETAAHPR